MRIKYLMLGFFLLIYSSSYCQQNAGISAKLKHFFQQDSISWSVDLLTFGRFTSLTDKLGGINPENRIAQLEQVSGGLFFRPDISYTLPYVNFSLKPRLNFNFNEKLDQDGVDKDFYFQELSVKSHLNKKLYLKAGRYVKSLGTSIFVNPSNPFLLDPGALNPKLEAYSRDFVEFNLSTNSDFNFSFIANVGEGRAPIFDEHFFEFNRIYAISSEYYGKAENLGLILSISEGKQLHAGFYGQKNLGTAILVWVDASLGYNINRFYAAPGHQSELLSYEMVNGAENEKTFFTGLIGGSYTFRFGPTLNMEYYFNGKGYSNNEFDAYNLLIADAENYNFDITAVLADLNLGRAINTGMPYIRRHYIFTQFGENDVFGKFNYSLRYFYSFDDQSSQFSTLLEYNLGDNIELFNVSLINLGNRSSDFRRLLNCQIMLGMKGRF